MWKQIFDVLRGIAFLTRDTAELRTQTRELREDLDSLQDDLTELAYKFELLGERERLEREKLALMLDNALLRMERRLPPPKPGKGGSQS